MGIVSFNTVGTYCETIHSRKIQYTSQELSFGIHARFLAIIQYEEEVSVACLRISTDTNRTADIDSIYGAVIFPGRL